MKKVERFFRRIKQNFEWSAVAMYGQNDHDVYVNGLLFKKSILVLNLKKRNPSLLFSVEKTGKDSLYCVL